MDTNLSEFVLGGESLDAIELALLTKRLLLQRPFVLFLEKCLKCLLQLRRNFAFADEAEEFGKKLEPDPRDAYALFR